ncbi:MAG: DUF421 domain-containing protein [Oscillospiraceae bacterium]|nr:DUF421 domain-containing protein [Oscillospiraceae bacterium]
MPYSIVRTLIFYLLLLLVVRLLGKRQIGEMEPTEIVVTMLLANLASITIENLDFPIWYGVVPIALVFGAELLLSHLTFRSIHIRRLFCGKPVILIDNGKIDERNLRRTRVNLDELTMHLRENGVFDPTTVKFAILETNGQLSTLLYGKDQPASAKDAGQKVSDTELPVTLISDGKLLRDNLPLTQHGEDWVKEQLAFRRCGMEQVLLMTVDASGHIIFIKKAET